MTKTEPLQKSRAYIKSLGMNGKVAIDYFQPGPLPFVDNLVNLLVIDSSGLNNSSADNNMLNQEVMRIVAPLGAVILMKKNKIFTSLKQSLIKKGFTFEEKNDYQILRKPWPKDIDQWTHYLHGPDNNAVANDNVVGRPKHFQWISEPKWARSHEHLASLSAMVSSGGRIFHIVDKGPAFSVALPPKWVLAARDAFSGVLLWEIPVSPWEGQLRGFRSGPADISRRLVADENSVFITPGFGKPVSRLDGATGKTLKIFKNTENTLEFIVYQGILYLVVGDSLPTNTDNKVVYKLIRDDKVEKWPEFDEVDQKKHIMAININSGALLWKKSDKQTENILPLCLIAADNRVFFQNYDKIIALDHKTGKLLWETERSVSKKRPSHSPPTLVAYQDIILSADFEVGDSGIPSKWISTAEGSVNLKGTGELIAFAAVSGKKLWSSPANQGFNNPPDVLVSRGTVWAGKLAKKRDPGITTGLDIKTGQPVPLPENWGEFRVIKGHHLCYRNKATDKYLILGRNSVEFVDLETGKVYEHTWLRGTCQYGIMPSNGLLYVPQHSCACYYESLLNSINAVSAGSKFPVKSTDMRLRTEKGPAYDSAAIKETPPDNEDWPTFRHDNSRSGSVKTKISVKIKPLWKKTIGGKLSQPVCASGKLFVSEIDEHTVHALNAKSGSVLWSYTSGSRIDSAPTIHNNKVYFGSADGWIYCLDAEKGRLVWRFMAARNRQYMVAYDQIESVWPVSGNVMVMNNYVYAVAGRTPYMDYGMTLYKLNAHTGELVFKTAITNKDALPDILSADQDAIYMRNLCFDHDGNNIKPRPHLYPTKGFLDDSWWHRHYWIIGEKMGSRYGKWLKPSQKYLSGKLLIVDNSMVYGFGRNKLTVTGSHTGISDSDYYLYSANLNTEKKTKDKKTKSNTKFVQTAIWQKRVPMFVKAMTLCNDTLLVIGPKDVLQNVESKMPIEALKKQADIFDKNKQALFWAISAKDGKKIAEYPIESSPVFDGMIAVKNNIYISTARGEILCYGPE